MLPAMQPAMQPAVQPAVRPAALQRVGAAAEQLVLFLAVAAAHRLGALLAGSASSWLSLQALVVHVATAYLLLAAALRGVRTAQRVRRLLAAIATA